jgi:hypothetical protein
MCGHWLFAAVVVAVVLWPTAAAPADPVRVNDLKDNVQVRLVAAKVSEGRGQELMAKFETLDEARKEILVGFPAHSFTTHEQTLMSIIWGCIDHPAPRVAGWRKVKDGVEAIFSVPKDGIHGYGARGETYERCYLVSLKLGGKK